jgi:hypothetical protein
MLILWMDKVALKNSIGKTFQNGKMNMNRSGFILITTSGGGFALMTEGLSLAGNKGFVTFLLFPGRGLDTSRP